MTKKELLAKNAKLKELDDIIRKRPNTPTIRQLVADKVAEGFGVTASVDDIFDLFEYYDIMTNDATMVGSKVFDSTLFEPIKTLALAYRQDLEDLGKLYEKDQVAFEHVVENAHNLKENYKQEQEKRVRSEKEVAELMEKVAKLEAQKQEQEKLLAATKLSSKQKAAHVVKAETEAAEAIQKSTEWEEKFNAINSEFEKLTEANQAANKQLDEKNNELAKAQGSKGKWKVAALTAGAAALLFGAAAVAHLADWGKTTSHIDEAHNVTELADHVIHHFERELEAKGKIYSMYIKSKDSLEAGKNALAAAEQTYTVQDAMAKVEDAYQITEDELATIETLGQNIESDRIALSTASDSEVATYAMKALDYSSDITNHLQGVEDNYNIVIEAIEVASQALMDAANAKIETLEGQNANLQQEVENLQDQKAELEAAKAELEAYVVTLETENHNYEEQLAEMSEKYQEAFSAYINLINFGFEKYGFSISDCYMEEIDGQAYLLTFEPVGYTDIKVAAPGVEAYNEYQSSGKDTLVNTTFFASVIDMDKAFKGLITVEAANTHDKEEDQQTAGNEGQGQEISAGDDAGTPPNQEAPSEDGNIVQNPTENEETEGNEPSSSEISDGGEEQQEPAEENQGEPAGYGNNGRG